MQSFAVFCTKAALPITSLAAALASFRKNAISVSILKPAMSSAFPGHPEPPGTKAVPL